MTVGEKIHRTWKNIFFRFLGIKEKSGRMTLWRKFSLLSEGKRKKVQANISPEDKSFFPRAEEGENLSLLSFDANSPMAGIIQRSQQVSKSLIGKIVDFINASFASEKEFDPSSVRKPLA